MNQSIGQKFNVISLLRFAAPSIIMMVFMSVIYDHRWFLYCQVCRKRSSFGCEYCLSGSECVICLWYYVRNRRQCDRS